MLRNSLIILLILAFAVPAVAGDPLDTNDRPKVIAMADVESACGLMEKWPDCVPCATSCFYAIMAESWGVGGWNDRDW